MKDRLLILFLLAFSFAGCSKPSEKDVALIVDYIQTTSEGKSNQNISVTSIEQAGIITGEDSLQIVEQEVVSSFMAGIVDPNTRNAMLLNWPYDSLQATMTKRISNLKKMIESHKQHLAKINGDSSRSKAYREEYVSSHLHDYDEMEASVIHHSTMLALAQKYSRLPDETLCLKKRVDYTINNPSLKDTQQKVSKIILFSKDQERILGELPIQ